MKCPVCKNVGPDFDSVTELDRHAWLMHGNSAHLLNVEHEPTGAEIAPHLISPEEIPGPKPGKKK